MIAILGDWTKKRESFFKAEAHLIDTEENHCIYGTKDIINIVSVLNTMPFLDYFQIVDLIIFLLSMCDTVYMLKDWEYNNDTRMLHDYADAKGYKIIYSKKF